LHSGGQRLQVVVESGFCALHNAQGMQAICQGQRGVLPRQVRLHTPAGGVYAGQEHAINALLSRALKTGLATVCHALIVKMAV
jgi:hypothetical protein